MGRNFGPVDFIFSSSGGRSLRALVTYMYIIIHNLQCGLPNLLLYYTFLLKIKNREVCQFGKILGKMVVFRGVAALRGNKKFFTLASLAGFRFRKLVRKRNLRLIFLVTYL